MTGRARFFGGALSMWIAATAPALADGHLAEETAGARAPECAHHDPLRQPFYGDLHIHTGISMDAWMFGTRPRPADAYRFARGETLALAPLDEAGKPTRTIQLDRPLDFAAVTDHASNFGGVKLCTDAGSAVYDSAECQKYRAPLEMAGLPLRQIVSNIQDKAGTSLTSPVVCGEDGARCRAAAGAVWKETQDAAAAYDDSTRECRFTTFVAYEYTATPELTKIHRNVIFRNETVLPLPISYADEPEATTLWRRLKAECIDARTGCDVLAIPHNSNLSNGNMFALEYGEAKTPAAQAVVARLRADIEPVVEMSQMKGDSECRNGMWDVLGGTDELCDWEKMRAPETPDCKDGKSKGALGGEGCISRRDFVRYALVEGLMEAERLGVNPFAFGFIAATDGHDAAPGAVEESRLDLNVGRVSPARGRNNGGLAGVWAEENSRDAIFDALRRRETFGTSGPRISVRLFGGWHYPETLCDAADLVAKGYAGGVPMGGELAAAPDGAAGPTFVVSALRDPGTAEAPGGLLQRIQIVKGWADDAGKIHQQVVDVVGGPNDASVDTATCRPSGAGHDSLCAVWTDPDFDPKRRAVYYARVVENPSCRVTGWACAVSPADEQPPWCKMPGLVKQTQERAWTSPIWYGGS